MPEIFQYLVTHPLVIVFAVALVVVVLIYRAVDKQDPAKQ